MYSPFLDDVFHLTFFSSYTSNSARFLTLYFKLSKQFRTIDLFQIFIVCEDKYETFRTIYHVVCCCSMGKDNWCEKSDKVGEIQTSLMSHVLITLKKRWETLILYIFFRILLSICIADTLKRSI